MTGSAPTPDKNSAVPVTPEEIAKSALEAGERIVGDMTNNSGRNSSYTQQEADRICDLISLGHSWKDICKRVGRSYRTILRWKRRHSEFDVAISRARADAAYVTYEHIRQIERRMAQPEWIYDGVDEKGKPKRHQNPDWIDTNAGASIIRSMQWRMNHDNWAAFGDRRKVNISGTIEHQPVSELAPEWIREAIAAAPNVTTIEGEATEVDAGEAGDDAETG